MSPVFVYLKRAAMALLLCGLIACSHKDNTETRAILSTENAEEIAYELFSAITDAYFLSEYAVAFYAFHPWSSINLTRCQYYNDQQGSTEVTPIADSNMRWIGDSFSFDDCLSVNFYQDYFKGGFFNGELSFMRHYDNLSVFEMTLNNFTLRDRLSDEAIPISGELSATMTSAAIQENESHLFTTDPATGRTMRELITTMHYPENASTHRDGEFYLDG